MDMIPPMAFTRAGTFQEDTVLQNAPATQNRTTSRLLRYLLLALTAGSLVVALFALIMLRSSGEPALVGTDLDGKPAPDFSLTDYRGQTVSLSDLRGQAVVLTFIYTNCPDVCPVTARNLQTAYEQLPEEKRDDVALVAITVDPERDTSEALRTFSERHGLAENPSWYALHGDRATLEPVWQAYGVYPGRIPATLAHEHSGGKSPEASESSGGEGHTDAIYFIDPDGRERVLMRSYADPAALVYNLEVLTD